MNKHIELVKKWLADPESVSLEELKANREAARDNWDAGATRATIAAYWAADAAVEAVKAAVYWAAGATAVETVYWRNQTITYIKQYEELTK